MGIRAQASERIVYTLPMYTFANGCALSDWIYQLDFTLTPPVSIPTTLLLFGSALGLLGWLKRRPS